MELDIDPIPIAKKLGIDPNMLTSKNSEALILKSLEKLMRKKALHTWKNIPLPLRNFMRLLRDTAARDYPDLTMLAQRTIDAIELKDADTAAFYGFCFAWCTQETFEGPIWESFIKQHAPLVAEKLRRKQAVQDLYQKINVAVETHIAKRGNHKQPSLTAIRQRVAKEFDVSPQTVLNARPKKK